MATIGETLRDARDELANAGIEDAHLEAEVLLGHALGMTREALYARLREPLPDARAFRALLQRRFAHEPAAYITGHREFYDLDLLCTPDALIPRPETELLVELALNWVKGQGSGVKGGVAGRRSWVADVGTGNGAIAVAIAVHAPEARVVAIDVARPALALAHRNAERHGVRDRIDFVHTSLLAALRGPLDVIVGNLPYVSDGEYARVVPEVRWEPEEALHAGLRGTELIEALLSHASGRLAPGGLLLAEHAWDQGERLRTAGRESFPDARIETKCDLAGEERALVVAPPIR
jgi:release factor glutamine methyltransferase